MLESLLTFKANSVMVMPNSPVNDDLEIPDHNNQHIQLYKFGVPVVILVCLLASALNCLLLFNVCRIKCPLKATTILTLSLSAADAWSSLLVAMGFFVNAYLPVVLHVDASDVYCVVLTVEGFRLGSIFTSTTHFLYMASAHFITAKSSRPTSSASMHDKRCLITAISLAFVVPPAFFLILFSSVRNQGFQSYGCWDLDFLMELTFRAPVFGTVIIAFLLISCLYVSVYRAAIRKSSVTIPGPPSLLAVRKRKLQRKRKVAVTLLLVTFSFFLGWLPVFLTSVLLCPNCSLTVVLRDWRPLSVPLINFSVNILLAVKFLLNPVLYALRVPEVRLTFNKLSSARSTRTGYESLSPQSLPMLPRTITSANSIENSRKVARTAQK